MSEVDELELTTSQQLYIEVVESKVTGMTDRFKAPKNIVNIAKEGNHFSN